jgi:acyl-CoA thioesterase
MLGKLSDTSEIKGWIKFKNDRPFDVLSILLIADSFPPAVISSQGMVAWVPTIELSVNVRKLPTTDWLKCSFRTRFITCGLLEEDGEIWDQKGELIAISRQIAQYRAPST